MNGSVKSLLALLACAASGFVAVKLGLTDMNHYLTFLGSFSGGLVLDKLNLMELLGALGLKKDS